MRQPPIVLVALIVSVLLAGCTTAGHAVRAKAPSFIPRPLVERELGALLLTADQVNAAMQTTGMAITSSGSAMADNSAGVAPAECLALDGPAEAAVYANNGFTAERDQSFNNGDRFTHYLKQAVVLYPVVDQATAFLDASARQWRTCSEFTHPQSGSRWSVGPISYAHGTLSAVVTQQEAAAPGWGCGRAIALRNNVVIDINTCSAAPGDSALRIANQIGETVAAQW